MSFITSPGVIFPPLTAGGVAYGTGSQAKVNTAGILGQYLVSGGAGVPTFTNLGTFTTINCTNLVSSGTLASSFTVTSGTAVPLTITNVGTGDSFVVEDSANPDASPFVIDAAGNIASGLTSTTLSMEIYRTVAANLRVDSDGFNSTIQARSFNNTSADTGPILNFARFRGTKAISTIVQSGDLLAQFRGGGYDGAQVTQAANIEVRVDGTPGTNDMPGRLVFSTTADGASSPTERLRIDSVGAVGIGSTSLTGYSLKVGKNITGAVNSYGIASDAPTLSDVTSSANYFTSSATTQATAFTLSNLRHYYTFQSTFGAGSTVTNQYGFVAESNLTGATNNYGYYSNIASAANRYNFYANGTAINYFAGVVQTNAATAIPAGGTAGAGVTVSSTANFGVFFGSGAPTLTAAKGSLYLRSDGSTTTDRMYVNTNGSTTWTNVVTSA